MRGHLDVIGHQAPATAATASANGVRSVPGGAGSTPASTSNTVKYRRTASARAANRRSHPRTVSTGRPSSPAITRTPTPDAFAARAAPVTSVVSARLTSANTGRSTCEVPHLTHLARRGRTTASPPAASLSNANVPSPTGSKAPRTPGRTTRPQPNASRPAPGRPLP